MPTHYKGSKSCRSSLNACLALIRASNVISARLSANVSSKGLTLSQWNIIDCLATHGPLKARDITAKMQKSDGNTTYVVNNLEKQRLVERTRSTEDRRQLEISLTEAGKDVYERHQHSFAAGIEALFSCLSETEKEQLRTLARTVGTKAEGFP